MRRLWIMTFALLTLTGTQACSPEERLLPEAPQPEQPEEPGQSGENDNPGNPGDPPKAMKVQITIGRRTFTATLRAHATAAALGQLLPMTVGMSEMNNNEKYYNLPRSLPTEASAPGTIRSGDLMLYGSGTLVLFYKTFATSYSYTRIGSIDDPSGLEAAVGTGSVTVTINKTNN